MKIEMKFVDPIRGVWTPWADVLCRNCHDALGDEVTAKRKIEWRPDEKGEGDGQGFCTECGCPVWVDEDVAQLTRLQRLAGGEMEQTGGMCSALTIRREDGGTVVVTNMDEGIVIGIYPPGEWEECGREAECFEIAGTTPDEDAAAAIRAAVARKA